jgi:hypothetical protein
MKATFYGDTGWHESAIFHRWLYQNDRRYTVRLDVPIGVLSFFGLEASSQRIAYAVMDDFGNLVRVAS